MEKFYAGGEGEWWVARGLARERTIKSKTLMRVCVGDVGLFVQDDIR